MKVMRGVKERVSDHLRIKEPRAIQKRHLRRKINVTNLYRSLRQFTQFWERWVLHNRRLSFFI